MVGGESAGGGLCAALCMMARDKGEVNIAYQMPLYLKKAGVEADIDVYRTNMHAFDMMKPRMPLSQKAAKNFNAHFKYALKHYFAVNEKNRHCI